MNGLCIVGTDTGVGKTYIVAALARLLRHQGHAVRVCKPVATGAAQVGPRLLSEDTRLLVDALHGGPEDYARVTPWVFAQPAAPPVAARAAGQTLSLPALVAAVRSLADPGTFLLVEGVGGLLCPLTDTETVADLAAELRLPLLIVARRSLGTLNHTLLTLEVATRRGLPVAGVLISETTPVHGLAEETCIDELRRRKVPVLAVVPHETPAPEIVPALAAVDWLRLRGSE